jgi:hypothetical protein
MQKTPMRFATCNDLSDPKGQAFKNFAKSFNPGRQPNGITIAPSNGSNKNG